MMDEDQWLMAYSWYAAKKISYTSQGTFVETSATKLVPDIWTIAALPEYRLRCREIDLQYPFIRSIVVEDSVLQVLEQIASTLQ